MNEVEVLVRLNLEKTLLIELEENESVDEKAMQVINNMTHEECKALLSSTYNSISISKITTAEKVKIAIDDFDPYCVLPRDDGPFNEYDGESRRISKKIKPDMSKLEVADIIAKEFTESFGREFTIEECMSPAEKIYVHLFRQIR